MLLLRPPHLRTLTLVLVLCSSRSQGQEQPGAASVSDSLLHFLEERSSDEHSCGSSSSPSAATPNVQSVQVVAIGDSITVGNASLIPGFEGMTFSFPFEQGSYPVELRACLEQHEITVSSTKNYAYGGAGAMKAAHMPETLTHPGCSSYWDNEIKERAKAAICSAMGSLPSQSALIITVMFGTNDGKETSLGEDASKFIWDYRLLLENVLGLDDCEHFRAEASGNKSTVLVFLLKPPNVRKAATKEDLSVQIIHDVIRVAIDQVAYHIRAAISERTLESRIHVIDLDSESLIRGEDGGYGAFWLPRHDIAPESLSELNAGGDGVHLNFHGNKRLGLGLCQAVIGCL